MCKAQVVVTVCYGSVVAGSVGSSMSSQTAYAPSVDNEERDRREKRAERERSYLRAEEADKIALQKLSGEMEGRVFETDSGIKGRLTVYQDDRYQKRVLRFPRGAFEVCHAGFQEDARRIRQAEDMVNEGSIRAFVLTKHPYEKLCDYYMLWRPGVQ